MTTIEYGHLYIDGQWAAPASAERIRVTEAATEEHLGSVPAATERDIDAAVGAARKAFDDPEGWATWSPARRRRPCWTHSSWGRRRWRPGCRRECSRSARPAGTSGPTWSRARAWTRCRSPAPPRLAAPSPRPAAGCCGR